MRLVSVSAGGISAGKNAAQVFGNLRIAGQTVIIVAVLIALRAVLWELGVEGMSATAVSGGIITAGVFVMGLVVAGTLSDYRDAERLRPSWPLGSTRSCASAKRSTAPVASPTWRYCGG
jgi:hypothetical protein